ncbi:MAG: energy transducer TonB [Blastocatellia bacterium]
MKYDYCPALFLRAACGSMLLLVVTWAQSPTTPKPASQAPQTTATPKPSPSPATAKSYIASGIVQYRKGKFDLAIKQFLAALKLEPDNDEALGYASLTAYQLGNQMQARDLFQRRANLPNQKSTVSVFCNYMVALTWWREAHELIAKRGELKPPKTVYTFAEKELAAASLSVSSGLASIGKVLAAKPDYAEALNLQNLLHAEAALLATDESKAEAERKAALVSLRQAIKLHHPGNEDFGAPTLMVGEFGLDDEIQKQIADPLWKLVDGGQPLTRTMAILPIIKVTAGKTKSGGDQPAPTGVGPGGSAVSIGPGQGALRPSKTEVMQLKGGKAKVEVLVSTTGKVVFARILDGPPVTTGPSVDAAKKWTFAPPKFEGQPVQVLGVITFEVKSIGEDKSKAKSATKPKALTEEPKKKN